MKQKNQKTVIAKHTRMQKIKIKIKNALMPELNFSVDFFSRRGSFIRKAHFIHKGNSKCLTEQKNIKHNKGHREE